MALPVTSGTYTYTQSTDKIIRRALRLLNAISAGETPAAQDESDCLDTLNAMTKAWMADGIHVWAEITGTIFLQPAQIQYQLGVGSPDRAAQTWTQTSLTADVAAAATSLPVASIAGISNGDQIGVQLESGVNYWTTVSGAPSGNTVTLAAGLPSAAAASALVFDYAVPLMRPLRVPAARRYNYQPTGGSPIETPVIMMSRIDYANLPNKNTPGIVTQAFFDPQMGNNSYSQPGVALMNVWPAPSDNTNALKFTAQRPLQDFDSLANVPDFPQEWLLALGWGLALEMTPEWDVPPERYQMIAAGAARTKAVVSGWDREQESVMFGAARR